LSESALTRVEPAALTTEQRMDKLRERYHRIEQRDIDIVAGMNRFAELPSILEDRQAVIEALTAATDEPAKQLGFKTKRELRMALYGTLPKKDWPAAMQAAHERVGMRLRRQDSKQGRTVFNLNMVTIPAPRELTEDDKIITIEPERK
jgi:hypothetical protein